MVMAKISERWDADQMFKSRTLVKTFANNKERQKKVILDAYAKASEKWFLYEHIFNFFEDLGNLYKNKCVSLAGIDGCIGNGRYTMLGSVSGCHNRDKNKQS